MVATQTMTGAVFASLLATAAAAATCEGLSSMALDHSTIDMVQSVAAGQFAPPAGGGPGGGAILRSLPAFCRVTATLRPVSDSEIKIEVWLPVSGWNGKLQSVGNGAWAGSISYPALAQALTAGYAAASTDTGHTGNNPKFVPGHPEKVIDFAYRSVHEMTIAAKAIVAAYFGNAPARAYFNGCSTGGRQALTEAQRFPSDYDGIVAGAPAYHTTHLQAAQVWTAQATHQQEASYIPPAKYAAIHRAVLEACDKLDGVRDGVLEDPTRCHFDPAVLACKEGDGPSCLTTAQVELARKAYAGPVNPRTGQQVFPGLEPGSEQGWSTLLGPQPMSYAAEVYQHLVLQDSSWDYLKFDIDRDVTTAEKKLGALMDATDANLKPFTGRGGKLILYHGWSDPGIPPLSTVQYYSRAAETLGGAKKAADSVRLFMVPGMGHCRGGDGTDTFDAMSALDQWVVRQKAPDQIPASHGSNGVVDKTRPLCSYPQVAKYKGNGDTNDAVNFTCKMP
ncbi:MAG: tannase/feruloyl esterase family alpha/beta hydrolase [Terriglobia bacterium]|nr:MAG: tannase/feruloyl esterase family alpha/beta hydrolase [Terriglobia bacterium]